MAQDAIESLSASKLAKSICSQFRTRLNSSHEAFAASLRQVRGSAREELPGSSSFGLGKRDFGGWERGILAAGTAKAAVCALRRGRSPGES